ncbi:DUF7019 family protein [Lentzea sp. NPDC058436]|uniref:DUF7019 family protein n=1 Tax=Lentzea sp. NPDC058436 TaxID=3346499 RepID=UPI00366174D7
MSRNSRHYVYISWSKVNMHFEQLDPDTVASARVATGVSATQGDYAKLAVVEHVLRSAPLGTVEHPGTDWFEGELSMQWGPLDTMSNSGMMVWFLGKRGDSVVGLAGSSDHIVGFQRGTGYWSYSSLPAIVKALHEHREIVVPSWGRDELSMGNVEDWRDPVGAALRDVAYITALARCPEQRVRFLAHVLYSRGGVPTGFDSDDGHTVTLATPLYVAL